MFLSGANLNPNWDPDVSRCNFPRAGILLSIAVLMMATAGGREFTYSQDPTMPQITVRKCDDFRVNGRGDSQAWSTSQWVAMNRRSDDGHDYTARFKILYSSTGVYVLFDGSDRQLTATMTEDFDDLWKEDVYECFFWTDPNYPIYFEYEISPLGFELPILVPNFNGRFLGWRPWNYEGDRKTKKAVTAIGGPVESMAAVERWRAEVFIPFTLLSPLPNVPPEPGSHWRANFYRVDYDEGRQTQWDWARVGINFHEYQKFGTLIFE